MTIFFTSLAPSVMRKLRCWRQNYFDRQGDAERDAAVDLHAHVGGAERDLVAEIFADQAWIDARRAGRLAMVYLFGQFECTPSFGETAKHSGFELSTLKPADGESRFEL